MKKNFFFWMAAIVMLIMSSCQQEAGFGTEATVSFQVGTPEIATRAYSDGTTATVLQYAVYDADGKELTDLTRSVALGNAETINTAKEVKLQLTTGNKYSVIFWAAAPNAPYTVDFANKTMTVVDYSTAVSNDENRDAFYKFYEFTVTGAQTEVIELRRPFAQLNIGTNDYEASKKAGYEPKYSSVKVSNVYNTLDLVEGKVSGATAVVYGYNAIPTNEAFPVTGYEYLAMNYLLVDSEKEVVDVEFGYTELEATAAKTRTVGSVPVQRNYRTNIYGQLLTSNVDVNVIIEPEYEEPAYELDELRKAALNGGEVTLTDNVVLTKPLVVYGNMTIDLNGKTISNANDYAIENYGTLTIKGDGNFEGLGGIRSHGGEIIIEGGNYTGSSDWNNGTYQHILKAKNTEVVINGGVFDATIGGITNAMINVSENSVVTINGGTFKNVNGTIPQFAPYMFTYEKNGKLIINGGDFYGGWRFNGETATTDIYGGNFTVSYDGQSFHATSTHVLSIYGGVFSLENGGKLNPNNHSAAGYAAVDVNGLFYVLPEAIADAADVANVTTVTESTAAIATALATNNGEATMFMWKDVAYIAKYGEVVIASSAENATTARGIVEEKASLKSATVSEGVEVVGDRTFRRCYGLESVVLPSTLVEIGPAVFQSCSKLANVTIPGTVQTIGEEAFGECVSLTSINIPDGITRLEKKVFCNTGLTSIEIPASVNYIGTYAFRDCEDLTEVKILSPKFTMETNAMLNAAAPYPTMTIYVVNQEMKEYVEQQIGTFALTYTTVVVM